MLRVSGRLRSLVGLLFLVAVGFAGGATVALAGPEVGAVGPEEAEVLPDFESEILEVDGGSEASREAAVQELAARTGEPPSVFRAFILKEMGESPGKVIKVALTVGFINGVLATFSLLQVPGAELGQILPGTIFLGGLSVGLRLFPERMSKFFKAKGKPFLEKILRWFGVEFFFLTTGKVALSVTGLSFGEIVSALSPVGMDLDVVLASLGVVAGAAAGAIPIQGSMDNATAERNQMELALATTEAERSSINYRAAVMYGVASVLSTAASVAVSNGVPGSGTAMSLLAVVGVAYYIKSNLRARKCELAMSPGRAIAAQ